MEFLGETANTREVYLGLDGVVLCSRWEGLPNVVLEALAHGRPVVGTDVGDTGKLLRDRPWGWLVPPEDARSLADALCQFIDTGPEELASAGRLGAAFVLRELLRLETGREDTRRLSGSRGERRAGRGRPSAPRLTNGI